MQEICSVLKKGGIAVITVSLDENGYEVFKSETVYYKDHTSSPVFYERWYNRQQLQERLLAGSGLEFVDLQLASEKHLRIHHNYLPKLYKSPLPLRIVWNILESVVGFLNLRVGSTLETSKEGIVLLTLRKSLRIIPSVPGRPAFELLYLDKM